MSGCGVVASRGAAACSTGGTPGEAYKSLPAAAHHRRPSIAVRGRHTASAQPHHTTIRLTEQALKKPPSAIFSRLKAGRAQKITQVPGHTQQVSEAWTPGEVEGEGKGAYSGQHGRNKGSGRCACRVTIHILQPLLAVQTRSFFVCLCQLFGRTTR